jgi:tetratricopeptide (TPR) repeat protein
MKNYSFCLVFALCLFFYGGELRGQNLFDSLNTAKYADFLFLSANYQEAIEEYERLVFTYQAGHDIKLRLVKSYRLAGKPGLAADRLKSLWVNPEIVSQHVSRELFALKVINNDMYELDSSIEGNALLSPEEKVFFRSSSALFQEDYVKAHAILNQPVPLSSNALAAFRNITNDALSQTYKSPLLSGVMSAAIPGSGKMYAGNWEDGLLSLSIVGVSAWQAYRGFEKHGTNSIYGWIYSAISGAFYIGNIYGSVKETNRYNQQKKSRIKIRVEAVFYNNL